MTKTTSLARAEIALGSSMEEQEGAAPDPETPFRLLVLGDFSGRGSRGVREPATLGFDCLPVRVDCDNLRKILEERDTTLTLRRASGRAPETTFYLRSLEDLHHDRPARRAAPRPRSHLVGIARRPGRPTIGDRHLWRSRHSDQSTPSPEPPHGDALAFWFAEEGRKLDGERQGRRAEGKPNPAPETPRSLSPPGVSKLQLKPGEGGSAHGG